MKTKTALLVFCAAFFVANTSALQCNMRLYDNNGLGYTRSESCNGTCAWLSAAYVTDRVVQQVEIPLCLQEQITQECKGENIWPKLTMKEKEQIPGIDALSKVKLYCCSMDDCNPSLYDTKYSYKSPSNLRCYHGSPSITKKDGTKDRHLTTEECLGEAKQCIAMQVQNYMTTLGDESVTVDGELLMCGPPSGEDIKCDGQNIEKSLSSRPMDEYGRRMSDEQITVAYCCNSDLCNESLDKTLENTVSLPSYLYVFLIAVGMPILVGY